MTSVSLLLLASTAAVVVLSLGPTASDAAPGRGPPYYRPRPNPYRPRPVPSRPRVARSPRADNQRHGSVDVTADRTPGVGTSVRVSGSGDAWVSRDGNSRVTAGGHYGQAVGGPARGQKDYGADVRFEHRF